ncbi:hypothetical protein [Paenisporosarcina sp. OV554]|nr:hypothetical protein [Paenisporosarcina sp. OV554]PUB15943.1 hypothetical protein C8K15_103158 [Paenisporosarcina sp. OV554]
MKKKLLVTFIAAVIIIAFSQQGITLAENVLPRITGTPTTTFVTLSN